MINPNLPINKIAAIVVHKSKEVTRPFKNHNRITSTVRLPTTQFHGPKKDDLTGVKFGKFTVVGFALWRPNNWRTSTNTARWVVRCDCGRYEMRSTRAVKRGKQKNSCVECERNKNKL